MGEGRSRHLGIYVSRHLGIVYRTTISGIVKYRNITFIKYLSYYKD